MLVPPIRLAVLATTSATSAVSFAQAASNRGPSLLAPSSPYPSTTTTTTALMASATSSEDKSKRANFRVMTAASLQPRPRSIVYMAAAMSMHFGGYEFLRNSCLALFTSQDVGFTHPSAYPLANGLISPFSIGLLWIYSRQLQRHGPRSALRTTTFGSICFVGTVATLLLLAQYHVLRLPRVIMQALVGLAFLFQSSYQYLLYAQHWSFVGSVTTPDEGARWFGTITGISSLCCTLTSMAVPGIVQYAGVLGLMATTCVTLTLALIAGDRAYALSQIHGFDPAKKQQDELENKKATRNHARTSSDVNNASKFQQARHLFRRVPTLRTLLLEVLAFQSLNTILNVSFVRVLQSYEPNDAARSALTGRFWACVNGTATALQFLIMPFCMKLLEPRWIWRLMPLLPLGICSSQVLMSSSHYMQDFLVRFGTTSRASSSSSLLLLAVAFGVAKVIDYSIRSIVYVMVYQPLDFDSRFIGKEIIGVFGSRCGKSGMALFLSALTAVGWTALPQLQYFSLFAAFSWWAAATQLSSLLPSKAQAQALVNQRNTNINESKQQSHTKSE